MRARHRHDIIDMTSHAGVFEGCMRSREGFGHEPLSCCVVLGKVPRPLGALCKGDRRHMTSGPFCANAGQMPGAGPCTPPPSFLPPPLPRSSLTSSICPLTSEPCPRLPPLSFPHCGAKQSHSDERCVPRHTGRPCPALGVP